MCAHILSSEAARYNITFNDEPSNIAVDQDFEHRGVRFYAVKQIPHCTVIEKTVNKLRAARSSMLEIHNWSMAHCESVFSLCVYVAWVLRVTPVNWYYVYKFMRRRLRLLAIGVIRRDHHARVWPSIHTAWGKWLDTLLEAAAIGRSAADKKPTLHDMVVITDASKSGYGGLVFNVATATTTTYAGPWDQSQQEYDIQDLELLAVKETLTAGVPRGAAVRLLVDNTSVLYSLKKERSRRFFLNRILESIVGEWRILGVEYIRSADNPADAPSRGQKVNDQLLVEALTGLEKGCPKENKSLLNCYATPASTIEQCPIDYRDLI